MQWALLELQGSEWVFVGSTPHEELASEFVGFEQDEDVEITRKTIPLE